MRNSVSQNNNARHVATLVSNCLSKGCAIDVVDLKVGGPRIFCRLGDNIRRSILGGNGVLRGVLRVRGCVTGGGVSIIMGISVNLNVCNILTSDFAATGIVA